MPLRLSTQQFKQLLNREPLTSSKHKFRAVRTEADGIKFDSLFEARHYAGLKVRQAAGEIRNLRTHVIYPIRVGDQLVCKFEADFVYDERRGQHWHEVIEDTKSEATRRTRLYRVKYKLMAALGYHIREVLNRTHRKR